MSSPGSSVARTERRVVWYREVNGGIEGLEASPVAQIGQKFEHFLETYRRSDGSRWGGQDLYNATGGVVTRSYVTALRKGRIENPGFEKLRAMAKAMNFPRRWISRKASARLTGTRSRLGASLFVEWIGDDYTNVA